ncbi:MAG: malate/lactate/ureidoglycolate dehydrogenase [Acidimicrobiales bacterium]|nr:malate/lactate/ureidoglycolate dehydrogenase [Acidimicrobiales bacterium]
MPKLQPSKVHDFIVRTCESLGSEGREANLVADQLVQANLAGHDSHGVGMLPAYVDGVVNDRLKINSHPTVVVDSGSLLTLDGNAGYGQVNGFEAMQMGIERAANDGVAVVGLRNSYHIGRIGHWAEQCAASGYASMHLVNVIGHPPLVAAYGGAEARFGTNPFCAAVPGRDGRPGFLLDMATSIIAGGKARVAANKGEKVPPNTIIDVEGNLTDDPNAFWYTDPSGKRGGALVAFGDHKGSGLAIMCELLGAALLGGETAHPKNPRDGRIINSMLSVIIDPGALGNAETFYDEIELFRDFVLDSRLRADCDQILVPGQPEELARVDRADGFEVDPVTMEQLRTSAERAGVPLEAIGDLDG